MKLLQQLLPVVDRSGHVVRIYNPFVFPFSALPMWPFFTSSLSSSSCCPVYKVHTMGERICITRVGNFHPVHADSYKNGYSRRSRTSRTRFWLRRGYEAARHRENASHFYGVATNTEASTTKRSARQLVEHFRK